MSEKEVIQYKTCGTCCQFMQITVQDNKVLDAEFFGGCNGNLQGIKGLIIGMDIDMVIERLKGITCGNKTTSCPDQLAKSLIEYKQNKLAQTK